MNIQQFVETSLAAVISVALRVLGALALWAIGRRVTGFTVLLAFFRRDGREPYWLAGVILEFDGVLLLVEGDFGGVRHAPLAVAVLVQVNLDQRERIVDRPRW
jgi:drug/metabolite transporter (DMT)-like permease